MYLVLSCDNNANPPSGEHSLHHNNNLLDANLAKSVSGIDIVNFTKTSYRAETSRSIPLKKFAKLIGRTWKSICKDVFFRLKEL